MIDDNISRGPGLKNKRNRAQPGSPVGIGSLALVGPDLRKLWERETP